MKIYTKTGDAGETGLFGGGRVSKAHTRVAAYGTVDELNAFLGQALAGMEASDHRDFLTLVQHDLFAIGSVLCTPAPEPDSRRTRPAVPDVPVGRVRGMEAWIDRSAEEVEPLRNFILPGGVPAAAALHVARTVCRRAERQVVALAESEPVEREIVVYLNRLSDLLFALARLENHRAGRGDVIWRKEPSSAEAQGPGGARGLPDADSGEDAPGDGDGVTPRRNQAPGSSHAPPREAGPKRHRGRGRE